MSAATTRYEALLAKKVWCEPPHDTHPSTASFYNLEMGWDASCCGAASCYMLYMHRSWRGLWVTLSSVNVLSSFKCLEALRSAGQGAQGWLKVRARAHHGPWARRGCVRQTAPCVEMKRDGLAMWYVCVVECVVDLPRCTLVELPTGLVLSKV